MEIKNPSYIETKMDNLDLQNVFSSQQDQIGGWYVSANILYWLFGISDTIQDAVNRISWAFTQIEPKLQEIKSGEYITEHPSIELLKNTDMRFNEDQVKYEMMVSYCLAGECYPTLIGNIKYEPVALFHYPANNVSVAQGSDGYIQTIIASYQNIVKYFERGINPKFKSYIFNTVDGLNQTIQILNNRKRNYLRAQTPLEGVYYQAITKYYGNIHNSGIVRNGSRPGGLWSPDSNQALTQNQYESFKKEVKENFTGASNAGRNIVAPIPVKYQNFLLNTRDMDFVKMIELARNEIYSIYNIPLPLVVADTMTLNNYSKAVESFYDFAVLPRAKFLYTQLGNFILSRYKDGDKFKFVIDERQLSALKERMFDRSQKMRNIGAFSDSEIRNEVGFENIDGGDTIYKPANLVPTNLYDDYKPDSIQYDNQEDTDDIEDVQQNDNIVSDDTNESVAVVAEGSSE
jgi:HK97 family phage portal protein